MIEVELLKKDKLIEDLIKRPEGVQIPGPLIQSSAN
jgi:hypothetical protein